MQKLCTDHSFHFPNQPFPPPLLQKKYTKVTLKELFLCVKDKKVPYKKTANYIGESKPLLPVSGLVRLDQPLMSQPPVTVEEMCETIDKANTSMDLLKVTEIEREQTNNDNALVEMNTNIDAVPEAFQGEVSVVCLCEAFQRSAPEVTRSLIKYFSTEKKALKRIVDILYNTYPDLM